MTDLVDRICLLVNQTSPRTGGTSVAGPPAPAIFMVVNTREVNA